MVSISGTYIIGVMVLAYIIVDRPAWKKSPLDIPLLIYVVWGMFTLLVREPTQIIEAIRAQFAVLFFFLTAHAMHEDDLKSMGKWFLIAAAITGAWGVVQVASHVVYHPTATTYDYPAFYNGWPRMVLHAIASRDGRGVGTRSHPLTYAECLAPALFVVLAAVLTKRESRGRGLVLLACVVAGLICAKGRAIWGGMLVGLLAVSAFIPKKQRLILLGSMVLVGAVVFGASSELRGRALSTFSSTAGIQGDLCCGERAVVDADFVDGTLFTNGRPASIGTIHAETRARTINHAICTASRIRERHARPVYKSAKTVYPAKNNHHMIPTPDTYGSRTRNHRVPAPRCTVSSVVANLNRKIRLGIHHVP
jgi:hypothetical protein